MRFVQLNRKINKGAAALRKLARRPFCVQTGDGSSVLLSQASDHAQQAFLAGDRVAEYNVRRRNIALRGIGLR